MIVQTVYRDTEESEVHTKRERTIKIIVRLNAEDIKIKHTYAQKSSTVLKLWIFNRLSCQFCFAFLFGLKYQKSHSFCNGCFVSISGLLNASTTFDCTWSTVFTSCMIKNYIIIKLVKTVSINTQRCIGRSKRYSI